MDMYMRRSKLKGSGHTRRVNGIVGDPPRGEDNPEKGASSGVQGNPAIIPRGRSLVSTKNGTSGNGGYVTVAMLDLVRKQLEGKFEKEVGALRRTFQSQMEEWRENEMRLKSYIETLRMEVAKLVEVLQVKMGVGQEGEGDDLQDLTYQHDPPVEESASAPPSSPLSLASEESEMSESSSDDAPMDIIEGGQGGKTTPSTSEEGVVIKNDKAEGLENSSLFSSICDPDSFFAYLSDHFSPNGDSDPGEPMSTPEPAQAHPDLAAPQIQLTPFGDATPTPANSSSSKTENSLPLSIPTGPDFDTFFGYLGLTVATPQGQFDDNDNLILIPTKSSLSSTKRENPSRERPGTLIVRKETQHLQSKSRKDVGAQVPASKSLKRLTYCSGNAAGPLPKNKKEKVDSPSGYYWNRNLENGHGPSPSNPSQCICGSNFPDKRKFYKHIHYFNVTKGKGLSCPICERKFSYASQTKLNNHMANAHRNHPSLRLTTSAQEQKATSSSLSSSSPKAD